ncbi:hypothetical protein [Streptosporangium carneum]|uniref:Uncharacterized protein n=1 Tax=Streptosporangium carneum TaxID=47481 RepID=A0A9W6MGL2_9ACTN|nr:hypothetical protein [Streptosporangium carneum]GLK13048.1 hypothetical protein GCM10017600_64590 [Streptosporangium carneum]
MTEQLVQIPITVDGAKADTAGRTKGTYHLYWYGKDFKKTREEARVFAASQGKGHQLADIPSEVWRDSAAKYLDGPAWIYSWKGDDYDNGNVVLHPNGKIGVVEDGNQRLPFLISYVD